MSLFQIGCTPTVQTQNQVRLAIIGDVITKRDDPTALYFLSLDAAHSDPDPKFLGEIQKLYPQVRKGSSTSNAPPYLEQSTNKPGVVLWIGDLTISRFNRAKASVDIHIGFMAGGGSRIELKRINGQWIVSEAKPTWMS